MAWHFKVTKTFLQSNIAPLDWILEIYLKISSQKIFIITDESDIRGEKFVNSLIGLINDPTNAQLIVKVFDDVLKANNIERQNFL